jgi:hypothetical protein
MPLRFKPKIVTPPRCFSMQCGCQQFDADFSRAHPYPRCVECNLPTRGAEASHTRKFV